MKNESRKKSREKSKNVLEEKLKNVQAKNFHRKDQYVYNNCYELRSRAIKNVKETATHFRVLITKGKSFLKNFERKGRDSKLSF